MSRNGHFGFLSHGQMNGAFDAEDINLLKGLREEDAMIRTDSMSGAFDAEEIRILNGIREEDAQLRLGDWRSGGGSDYQRPEAGRGRFSDSAADLGGLREEESMLRLGDLRQEDANIRLGDDDYDRGMDGAFDSEEIRILRGPVAVPHVQIAVDERMFRHQFRNDLEGTGRIHGIGGIFDIFSSSLPSFTDFSSKARTVYNRWTNVRARLNNLHPQQRDAVIAQMTKMEASPGAYERIPVYIQEGSAGITRARVGRVDRLDTALPTIENLVSEMEAVKPAPTYQQEEKRAQETALKDVTQREQQAVVAATKGEMDLGKAATIGVVAVAGVGALYGVGKLLKIL